MALDMDKIGMAALKLLNEIGLDALSTRKLAAELNIQSPSLYKHFRNKAELLDHMVTTMLTAHFAGLDRDVAWDDWLRGLARASRAAIRQYRDGARLLVASSPSAPRRSKVATDVVQPLIACGFDYAAARHSVVILSTMVEGWMLNEQNDATLEMMVREFGDIDRAFDKAVEIIVAGLKAFYPPRE